MGSIAFGRLRFFTSTSPVFELGGPSKPSQSVLGGPYNVDLELDRSYNQGVISSHVVEMNRNGVILRG